jgi:centromere protein C
MARKRATVPLAGQGKRTGVQVFSSQDAVVPVSLSEMNQAMDAAFDNAASPPQGKENGFGSEKERKEVVDVSVVNKRAKIRWSLESTRTARGSDDEEEMELSTIYVKKKLGLVRDPTGRGSLSPSELSRVSTAPPSVITQPEQARHAWEPTSPLEQTQDYNTQEEDDFVAPPPDSPIQEDDNDDLMVPPPDCMDDDENEDPEEYEMPQLNSSPVDFPTPLDDDDQKVMDDDDDDDDDREGLGFQMADNDPTTPVDSSAQEQVRERKRKSPTAERTSKAKKPKAIPQSSDSSDAISIQPKKPRGRKARMRTAVFSPKGHQSGPLEYTAIPVTNSKDTPPKGLRRSNRTHVPPLQFWKNEGPQYVPNNFDLDRLHGGLRDSLHTFPVVAAYTKALPTPYKKPKPRHYVAPSTKEKASKRLKHAANPARAIEEEYDSSKLRKKYEIIKRDTANIWDDFLEENKEMSMCCVTVR